MKSAFGLIRDKDGKPRIDDPSTLHPGIASMMTPEERTEFNVWPGVFIHDAQGVKRADVLYEGDDDIRLRLVDPLVAARIVYHEGSEYTFDNRFDAPVGHEVLVKKRN